MVEPLDTEASFGRVLTEQRKRRGMSRSDLAELSDLSYPYVSQLETGLRKPSRKAAAQLARALGMGVPELEAVIPADESDEREIQRASLNAATLLRGQPVLGDLPMDAERPTRARRRASSARDDLVGHIVDLLEDLDADERVDALADVQKLVFKRMFKQR